MLEAFPSLRPGDAKSIRLRGLSRLFRSAESASALKAFWREGAEKSAFRSGLRPSWAWHPFPVSPEGGRAAWGSARRGSLLAQRHPGAAAAAGPGCGERGWEAVPRKKRNIPPSGHGQEKSCGEGGEEAAWEVGRERNRAAFGRFWQGESQPFRPPPCSGSPGNAGRAPAPLPPPRGRGAARGERQPGERPGCGKVAWSSLGSSWGARRGSRSARAPPPILLPLPSLPPSPGGLPAGLPSLPGASPERFPLIGFCGLWVFWDFFFFN